MRAFSTRWWFLTIWSAYHLSATHAEAKDFLWRVRSPTATVYLMGSVHLLRGTDYPLPTSFELAYSAAEQVAFEIDFDEASSPSQIEYTSGKAVYPAGQTIRSSLLLHFHFAARSG
ncbi:MAG: TraB/GumN family protein [Verrucomicrobia bacterium]|nr:TraB/GumN family protein [Verrucomicrobiota bacterium]